MKEVRSAGSSREIHDNPDKESMVRSLVTSHKEVIAAINGTVEKSGRSPQEWRPGHYACLMQSLRDLPRITTAAAEVYEQHLSSDDNALLQIAVGFFYSDFNQLYPSLAFPKAMQALDTVHGGDAGDRKELLRSVMNAASIKKGPQEPIIIEPMGDEPHAFLGN